MARREKDATVQVGLRVKESLRSKIEKSAKKSGVSMNAEIVRRLEKSFAPSVEEELREAIRAVVIISDVYDKLLGTDPTDEEKQEIRSFMRAQTRMLAGRLEETKTRRLDESAEASRRMRAPRREETEK
jgi:Arc-like DNA binding domain